MASLNPDFALNYVLSLYNNNDTTTSLECASLLYGYLIMYIHRVSKTPAKCMHLI